jgi:Flp pilus assembly pilin Flp
MTRRKTFWTRGLVGAFAREERGAAMVEFAIIAFLLLVMVFGMIDMSRYMMLRATLTNAVRDGARYGATLPDTPLDTVAVRIYTRQRMSLTASPDNGGNLFVTAPTGGTGANRVRVELDDYPFSPATFLVIKSGSKMTKVNDVVAEFRREYQ